MTMATQAKPRTADTPAPAAARAAIPFGGEIQILVLGALLIIAFWPILTGIYGSWLDEKAYMEHGLLVIPAAAYMAWDKRETLRSTPRQPSGWGVLIMLWGALQATLSMAAQWVWAARMSFLISLVGLVAAMFGWRMVRQLVYPLCTLILMIPPPTFIFERLTLSLQLLASRLGEVSLEALGYSVLREGNILEMVGIKLSVEEACSGIRSLVAIFFMCVLYNYFFVRGWQMKAALLALAIPVAILGNAVRILATGIASQYNPALVRGASHEAFGYVSVVAAAAGVVGVHVLLQSMVRMWRVRHA
jgi:exosortase